MVEYADILLRRALVNKEILHSAIAYLSRREHSEKELLEKLKAKQHQLDDIYPVLVFLKNENYQSDLRYAESYCRNRVAKGYGWLFIKNNLRMQNIDEQIINQVYKNDEIDWYLQAELAYNKRFNGRAITDMKDKAKRIRFLQYRGYTTEQIKIAINE